MGDCEYCQEACFFSRNSVILCFMKIVVTHSSPDMDAITSVWLIKRFLPDWADAKVEFVPAGQRLKSQEFKSKSQENPIEQYGDDDVLHVDTGLGPLDHHQTSSDKVCGATLTWGYVQTHNHEQLQKPERKAAISRIVNFTLQDDHFKQVFWTDPDADYHEMTIISIINGMKLLKPEQDEYLMKFALECLDTLMHNFENRVWAEEEIEKNGIEFKTRWGRGIGFETINDDVIKLSQKMGYTIVVRRDPRKGYARIKARPFDSKEDPKKNANLTLVYEQLKKIDPQATWFLHVSKKMLLNGTPKNPKMKPTTLSLQQIIQVLEKV